MHFCGPRHPKMLEKCKWTPTGTPPPLFFLLQKINLHSRLTHKTQFLFSCMVKNNITNHVAKKPTLYQMGGLWTSHYLNNPSPSLFPLLSNTFLSHCKLKLLQTVWSSLQQAPMKAANGSTWSSTGTIISRLIWTGRTGCVSICICCGTSSKLTANKSISVNHAGLLATVLRDSCNWVQLFDRRRGQIHSGDHTKDSLFLRMIGRCTADRQRVCQLSV